jgi:hypothetical protein
LKKKIFFLEYGRFQTANHINIKLFYQSTPPLFNLILLFFVNKLSSFILNNKNDLTNVILFTRFFYLFILCFKVYFFIIYCLHQCLKQEPIKIAAQGHFFVTFLLGHIENEKGFFKLVLENALKKNIQSYFPFYKRKVHRYTVICLRFCIILHHNFDYV